MKRIANAIILGILVLYNGLAQNPGISDSLIAELPPLEEIVNAALANSPMLKQFEKGKEKTRSESLNTRREWLDNVYLDGSVNYGMLDQIALTEVDRIGNSTGFLTTSQQLRYYAGLTVKMPISEIFGRKNNEKISSINTSISDLIYEEKKEEFRLYIIEEYFKLVYLSESMKSFSEIVQTFEISYLQAENDLRNGRISIADFAVITSTTGKSRDDYEKVRHNYYTQYFKIQSLTGIKLSIRNGY